MSLPGHRAPPLAGQPFSTDQYFSTQRPPIGLADKTELMRAFTEKWRAVEGKKVVLVTSGGTTVPLEANTVRFLDNFSAGTRGATSAEYFLRAGYAVIFLHRLHSLRPFSRHYSHSLNPFLDLLTIVPSPSPSQAPQIVVPPPQSLKLLPVLQAYHRTQQEGTLLSVDFQTVNEYLWLLKAVTSVMAPLGRRGMFYLAAAVSDFFLPEERVAEHKIQSTRGSLSLEMDQVPKVLKPLVQEWTPEGYIVSFKLETDPALLIPKSRAALSRYGHQLVIGNNLVRRKFEVVFVEPSSASSSSSSSAAPSDQTSLPKVAVDADDEEIPIQESHGEYRETWLRLSDLPSMIRSDGEEVEIEEMIINELVGRHERWIAAGSHFDPDSGLIAR